MRVLVGLVIASCRPAAPPPVPAPPPPSLAIGEASWPELGLELAAFSEIPLDRHPWPAGGVASQYVAIGERGRASWVVRVAPDESMRGFDDDHRAWARSEGPPVTACGQVAPVAIATHAAEDIECVIMADGTPNHPDHIAPRAAYALAVAHRGMTVVARFEVESEDIARWQPIALRFLGSLRCH